VVFLSASSVKCVLKDRRILADKIVRGEEKVSMSRLFSFPHGATAPSGPGLPNFRGFTFTLI
jgi:hypothetical protein